MATSSVGACILAVSIDGFSALLARDEAFSVDLLDSYEDLVGPVSSEHGGELLRTSGDQAILGFETAQSALEAAFDIQRRWTRHEDARLRMAIACEPGGEQAALRLQAVAPAGQVGVVEPVLEHLRGAVDFMSVSLGELYLTGRAESLPAFALARPEETAGPTPQAPPMRNAAPGETGVSGNRDLPPSMFPERRGFGDEREDREAEEAWDQALELPPESFSGEPDPLVEEYYEQTDEAAAQATAGFRGHAAAFVGVNAGLAGIWVATGAGFPWFLIPLFGWGIGLSTHYDAVRRRRFETQDMRKLGVRTREQLRTYRRLAKARAGWHGHLVSNVATSVLLFTINMITSPGFPWFLFPVGGMGIGLISHFPAYRAKSRRLRTRIEELGQPGATANAERSLPRRFARPAPPRSASSGGRDLGSGPAAEAESLRQAILEQIDHAPELSRESFQPVLEDYVSQVTSLAKTRDELSETGGKQELEQVRTELRELEAKLEATEDERLRTEYERSIGQLEKQQKTYTELLRDRELVEVRLRSAVNTLKQMRVEVARMRGLSGRTGSASIETLKQRSEELSEYLADLRRAYEELGE